MTKKGEYVGTPDLHHWTKAQEERLAYLHSTGITVNVMALRIGRSQSAIASRLRKMNLVPTYDTAHYKETVEYPRIPVSLQVHINKLRAKRPVYNLAEKGRPDLWQVGTQVKNEKQLWEMVA